MNYSRRRSAALAAVAEEVDSVLVTKLVNVRYLSGFSGSAGALLLRRDGSVVLATDGRYRHQASVQSPDVDLIVTRTPAPDLVSAAGSATIGIERHHVTLAAHDVLVDAAGGARLVGVGEIVEGLRTTKDEEEVAAVSKACAATDHAFSAVLGRLRPGVSERDVAWALLQAMREAGAEDAAFDTIVAFGPNSAIPHHRPTDRVLERGDLVKLDFGARVDGYHADMTRTVVCGPPADWQRELHAQIADVQQQCRAATLVGASPQELDALARRLIAEQGHELVHGLGHGVGLEIHEQPFLSPAPSAAVLREGTLVTVEPGIYLPGRGGVRIEDAVVVREDTAVPLTASRRDLVEI